MHFINYYFVASLLFSFYVNLIQTLAADQNKFTDNNMLKINLKINVTTHV